MSEQQTEQGSVEQRYGIASGIFYGIGCGIGGSIFILLGEGVEVAGSGVLISIFLGGLLILLTALNYSELETSLPISGGGYNFSKEASGGFLSFIIGFFLWLANIASCTFSALTFAYVLSLIFPFLSKLMNLIAILAVLITSIILFRTDRGATKTLIILTIFLIIIFAFFVFYGVVIAPVSNPLGFNPIISDSKFRFFNIIQMFALLFIFFTSITSNLAYFNADLKNPSKNIPKVNILAIFFTLLIYLGITSAVLINIGNVSNDPSDQEILLITISFNLLGPAGLYLMVLAAILATLIAMNAALSSATSVFHALARDQYMPKIFTYKNKETNVPTNALILTSVLSMILIMFTTVGFAAEMTTFIYFFALAFINFAAVSLRYKRKNLDRPFKAPLFPYLPIGVGITCLLLAFFLSFQAIIFGMLIFTIGMSYYLITIADRSSITLTLAGIKFFLSILIGSFIWILNNLSVLYSPIQGFENEFSTIFLRMIIFVCIFSFITIFFAVIPLTQIVYFFVKKINKNKVAITLGDARIIELTKTERKIIYNVNLSLGIVEIFCTVLIIIVLFLFGTNIISIHHITFGSTVLSESFSEYLFTSTLIFFAFFLMADGIVSLFLNREIKKIGI
ncbi:MAG: APC family permease [Promethearchaeota archaeon]